MEDPGPEAVAQQAAAEDGTVQGVLDGALHQQVKLTVLHICSLDWTVLSKQKRPFPQKCLERRWHRAGRAARRTAPAGAHCRSFPT